MEQGYIKIKNDNANRLVIEAKLVNCTLWMTKHEIADLFNVFVSAIGSNLRTIFKSGLLREENVTQIHKYKENGHQCEMIYYNLEVLIFISYRLSSYEASIFREWIIKSLTEHIQTKPLKEKEASIAYLIKFPTITLN